MEIVFEFLFDLFIEGSFELSNNKKISPWIRYPAMVIITLFILGILGLIGLIAVLFYMRGTVEDILIGIIFTILDLAIIIIGRYRFKEAKENKKWI